MSYYKIITDPGFFQRIFLFSEISNIRWKYPQSKLVLNINKLYLLLWYPTCGLSCTRSVVINTGRIFISVVKFIPA